MPKIIRNVKHKISRMERGQVLVIVALAAIGIIAVIGLSIDVGIVFIGNARLRRAVDAAALSAALQYRQNSNINTLRAAANEFLVLNGMVNPNSQIDDCDSQPTDPTLCPALLHLPPRKLIRVHATADIQLAFLPVIGINSVTLSSTAVSETASLDVVLVIDRSESMTYDANPGDAMRDPSWCNTKSPRVIAAQASSCSPFYKVVSAAIQFTNIMFFPYDSAAVVTFDKDPHLDLPLIDPATHQGHTQAEVINTLENLTVYQGDPQSYDHASSNTQDYRGYGGVDTSCGAGNVNEYWAKAPLNPPTNYWGLVGMGQDWCLPGFTDPPDPTHYTTTNIGGGLEMAGNQLPTDPRQQALWVVILLTDGVANAGYGGTGPSYYCPGPTATINTWANDPPCNDLDVADDVNPSMRPANTSLDYDASDYAYAMADFVGKKYPIGQEALIYTIGLGGVVNKYPQASFADPNSTPPLTTGEGLGKIFLNYAAAAGRGQAFYAASGADLDKIFTLIGTNIATRLSQ
jgi:Putative Flp pilus-assembly TadE/G-like